MGGVADNLLSSHRREDRAFYEKKNELKGLMPALGRRLEEMRHSGEQGTPVYAALSELRRQVGVPGPASSRVPLHVLLRGEDLLRREVPQLRSKQATS